MDMLPSRVGIRRLAGAPVRGVRTPRLRWRPARAPRSEPATPAVTAAARAAAPAVRDNRITAPGHRRTRTARQDRLLARCQRGRPRTYPEGGTTNLRHTETIASTTNP